MNVVVAGEISLGYTAPAGGSLSDLSQDGYPDLAIAVLRHGNASYICYGSPNGFSMQECVSFPWTNQHSTAFGDINGDGYQDFVLADHSGTDSNRILWGSPDGYSETNRTDLTGINGRAISLGDLDNDGDLDVVLGGPNPNAYICWNDNNTFPVGIRTVLPTSSTEATAIAAHIPHPTVKSDDNFQS